MNVDHVDSTAKTSGKSAVSCKTLNKIGKEQVSIGRAASWAIHFDRLLADSSGIETFKVSLFLLVFVVT